MGNMVQRATNEKLIPTSYCVPQEPIYGESYDSFWLTCLTDLLVFFPVKAINLIGLSHPTPHWPLKPRLKRCARLLDPLKASCKAGFKVAALEMKYDHVKRLPWKPYSIRRSLHPQLTPSCCARVHKVQYTRVHQLVTRVCESA